MRDTTLQRPGPTDEEIKFYRPDEIPPNLAPLDRARMVARQIRLWADFLLAEGPAPPQSEELTEMVDKQGGSE